MSKVTVYNTAGKEVGDVTLNPKMFDVPVRPQLVQQAVRTILANRRVAIAHTKTKAEVRGGGRKPWKQKGTGRARQGSIRNPQWKGGGVVFGPRSNRNFSLKMNKKAKRQALLMTLTDKAHDKKIIVLDKLDMPAIKTKEFIGIVSKLPLKGTFLTILPKTNQTIIKSVRNIPFAKVITADSLNVMDILAHQYVLCPKDSLAVMVKTYC
jgi:large subunit ribosomal protein L4